MRISEGVRYFFCLTLALLGPVLLVWFELATTGGRGSDWSLWIAPCLGAVFLSFISMSCLLRIFVTSIYLLLMSGCLFIFGLEYVCRNFANCL